MSSEIAAFVTAVGHAVNIAKAIVSTRDETKLAALNLEFTSAILDLTQKQLVLSQHQQTLLAENEALKKQHETYEQWGQERQRYQLHDLGRARLVYALKPEYAAAEPPHWLCAGCYNEGKKSILQHMAHMEMFTCPRNPNHAISA